MPREFSSTIVSCSIALILTSTVLCSCSTVGPLHPTPAPATSMAELPTPTADPLRSGAAIEPSRAPVTTQPARPTSTPYLSPSAAEEPPPIGEAPAATWGNLGPANIGDSVEAVSAKFGIEFKPVEWLNSTGDCGIAEAEGFDIALVVAKPGGVQVFVVADPRIPLVTGNQPVNVGDSLSDAAAAFPNWFSTDSYESLAGGPRGVVAPQELNQGGASQGRAILFEAGPDNTIKQYRVGVSAYSLHVDYCTTPD